MPTIDAAFGITIAIGLILGFFLAFVLFREKKSRIFGIRTERSFILEDSFKIRQCI